MTDPNRNRDEHRPLGEETPVPDHELNRDSDGHASVFNEGTYPDPTDRSDYSCRNCRQAIPADRTRCGYCGTSHSPQRNTADETSDVAAGSDLRQDSRNTRSVSQTPTGADRWAWREVIVTVVEATSELAAIAKASAACSFLEEANGRITKWRLVDGFINTPPASVAEPWGDLPVATQIDSHPGRRLLRQAIALTAWDDDPTGTEQVDTTATSDTLESHLYDETGSEIRTRGALAGLEIETTTPVWLVPAVAYGPTIDRSYHHGAGGRSRSISEDLPCHDCGCPTEHTFTGYDDGQYNSDPGQPVWQCRTCGAYRFGPLPDEAECQSAARSP